jgi:hypothetical protein
MMTIIPSPPATESRMRAAYGPWAVVTDASDGIDSAYNKERP